jgi:hypothetical protein
VIPKEKKDVLVRGQGGLLEKQQARTDSKIKDLKSIQMEKEKNRNQCWSC